MVGAILHFGDGLAFGQCAENQGPVLEQESAALCLVGWLIATHFQTVPQLPRNHQQAYDGDRDLSCLGLGLRGLGFEEQQD